MTRYTSTLGDVIAYGHGEAFVNGKPFELGNYLTYESPFAQFQWNESIMEFSIKGRSLRLDA